MGQYMMNPFGDSSNMGMVGQDISDSMAAQTASDSSGGGDFFSSLASILSASAPIVQTVAQAAAGQPSPSTSALAPLTARPALSMAALAVPLLVGAGVLIFVMKKKGR